MDGVGEEWWREGSRRGLELALEPEVLYNNLTYLQVAPIHRPELHHSGT